MPFSVSWHTLLDEADGLPGDATLVTPLSHKEFRITDTQEHRVIIEYTDRDRGATLVEPRQLLHTPTAPMRGSSG